MIEAQKALSLDFHRQLVLRLDFFVSSGISAESLLQKNSLLDLVGLNCYFFRIFLIRSSCSSC